MSVLRNSSSHARGTEIPNKLPSCIIIMNELPSCDHTPQHPGPGAQSKSQNRPQYPSPESCGLEQAFTQILEGLREFTEGMKGDYFTGLRASFPLPLPVLYLGIISTLLYYLFHPQSHSNAVTITGSEGLSMVDCVLLPYAWRLYVDSKSPTPDVANTLLRPPYNRL